MFRDMDISHDEAACSCLRLVATTQVETTVRRGIHSAEAVRLLVGGVEAEASA